MADKIMQKEIKAVEEKEEVVKNNDANNSSIRSWSGRTRSGRKRIRNINGTITEEAAVAATVADDCRPRDLIDLTSLSPPSRHKKRKK